MMATRNQAFTPHAMLALLRCGKAAHVFHVTGLKTIGDQDADGLAQQFVGGITKDGLGRCIEALEALLGINDNNGVLGQIKNSRHQR